MHPSFSIFKLSLRRLSDDWQLALSIFAGIAVATMLGVGTPIFLDSLEQLAYKVEVERLSPDNMSFRVMGNGIDLTHESMDFHNQALFNAIDEHIADIYVGHDVYFRGDTFLVEHPQRPFPDKAAQAQTVSRGYFQLLSGLAQHSRFLQGRMASGEIVESDGGPLVEGVVSTQTAEEFGLSAGDHLTFTPSLRANNVISVNVVGIFEPSDPSEEYWSTIKIFLEPGPMSEAGPPGIRVDSREPPLAVFLSADPMIEVVSRAYPGIIVNVNPLWTIVISTEQISRWPVDDVARLLGDFRSDLTRTIQESSVTTGMLAGLVERVQRQSFFARISILLLLVVMLTTMLLNVSMMVFQLSRNRRSGLALLKSRGMTTFQMLRLDALEGLVMVTSAMLIAPLPAFGLVALAGKLPFFSETTHGNMLPVDVGPLPFLFGAVVGALCLAIFIAPGLMSARIGAVANKTSIARPSLLPFFYKHYLDIGLLVVGGVIFAELRSRGQIVSGGLFREVEVNEAMLLAPVLFAIVVALIFIRVFPLLIRYVIGDSPAIVHLLVVSSVASLVGGVLIIGIQDSTIVTSALSAAMVLGVGLVYWVTRRVGSTFGRTFGVLAQLALTVGFFVLRPAEISGLVLVSVVAFTCIVPAQIGFLFFTRSNKTMAVWLLMGFKRMSRNPMQYTLMVLLLVLVTALGVLASTVGGTLERSQTERILYELASDMRITGRPALLSGGLNAIRRDLVESIGIEVPVLALREPGTWGPNSVQVLAVESDTFADVSWYREDFSESSLPELMGLLHQQERSDRLPIPDDATSVGLWIRPLQELSVISVWIVVQDGAGELNRINLSELGETEWQELAADLPENLERPLHLVSIQLFDPLSAVFGTGASSFSGAVLIDDVFARAGPAAEKIVLDDFEATLDWTPILTSPLSTDEISLSDTEAHSGRMSAQFNFGKQTNKALRGIYNSLAGGAVPVIVSEAITNAGIRNGDLLHVRIAGSLTPLVVRGTARRFPTIDPDNGAFMVTDLDQLLGYINLMGQLSTTEPNEMFIKTSNADDWSVQEITRQLKDLGVPVRDSVSMSEAVRLDPQTAAGWRTMLILSLAIVFAAAGFGYASYTIAYANETRGAVGVLRSLGFTHQQARGLITFEHLLIVVVGLVLGTWSGFQMSSLMASVLAVTEQGEPVVPPLVMTTDWTLLFTVFAVVIGIVIVSLFILNRSVARIDLSRVTRMEV